MATRRYSGNVSATVSYHEGDRTTYGRFPNGFYKVHLKWPGGSCNEEVGAPRALSHAVDSKIAFTQAVEAAITFYADATRNIPGNFEPDFADRGALVSTRKR